MSEQLRRFKVLWLVVFCLFFLVLYVGMKNKNLLGKFCIDTQFRVFIFRCQWKFLNDLFHALCLF